MISGRINKMKITYELTGLQEILVRKLANKYSNPWLKITVRKSKDSKEFAVNLDGNHMCNELGFRKELKSNGIHELSLIFADGERGNNE
jgi:hypothetical protein